MGKFRQIRLKIHSFLGSKIYPKWLIDPIPNSATLYRRIHFTQINDRTKKPASSAFRDEELSCDWSQHVSASESKELTGKLYKRPEKDKIFRNPEHYFIARLLVSAILQIENNPETIKHAPVQFLPRIKGDPNNRAHSLVISNLEEKLRVKQRKILSKTCEWEIFDEVTYTNLKNTLN